MIKRHNNFMLRKGQALVIVLLILAVITTVGLSIASRSVTEISTSTTNDESSRALAAAEAGIEAKLANVAAPSLGTSGETSVTTTSSYGVGAEVALNEPLAAGEVGTIFLATHDSNGNLTTPYYSGSQFTVCWGQGLNDANAPALELILYYKDSGGVYKVSRNTYDAASRGNFNTASYTAGGANGCPAGKKYVFSKNVVLAANVNGGGLGMPASFTPLFLRVRLFYNGNSKHYVGIKDSNGTFSAQGQVINSTGQAGVTSRKVQVFQQYSDPMAIFDSAVFSVGSLIK